MIRVLLFSLILFEQNPRSDEAPWPAAQERVVKLYGAGGVGRMEGYGTAVVVSPEGHLLTVDSPLLSSRTIRAVWKDGSKRNVRLIGIEPNLELAVLAPVGDPPAEPIAHFQVQPPASLERGDEAWVLSNAFGVATGDELLTLQKGIVANIASLAARRGTEQFTLPGDLYLIDIVTNNPGTAGGALLNARGDLAGIIGKELRRRDTNTWMNFAIPIKRVATFIEQARAGRASTLRPLHPQEEDDRRALGQIDLRGIRLLPEVLDQTPPFIDRVLPDSPAHQAGLLPDDLIVSVEETAITSTLDLRKRWLETSPADPIRLAVLRGMELRPIILPAQNAEEGSP